MSTGDGDRVDATEPVSRRCAAVPMDRSVAEVLAVVWTDAVAAFADPTIRRPT